MGCRGSTPVPPPNVQQRSFPLYGADPRRLLPMQAFRRPLKDGIRRCSSVGLPAVDPLLWEAAFLQLFLSSRHVHCVRKDSIPTIRFLSTSSRASKTSVASLRIAQFVGFHPFHLRHRRNDHLGYPITCSNGKGLITEIHQKDPYLTTIVAVDGPRRIEDGHTVLDGQAAACRILRLIPRSSIYNLGYACPFSRLDHRIFRGPKATSRRAGRSIGRKRKLPSLPPGQGERRTAILT